MPAKNDIVESRTAIEACKDRILMNVILIRQEYPYLFSTERGDMRGLLHTDIEDVNFDELGGV